MYVLVGHSQDMEEEGDDEEEERGGGRGRSEEEEEEEEDKDEDDEDEPSGVDSAKMFEEVNKHMLCTFTDSVYSYCTHTHTPNCRRQ